MVSQVRSLFIESWSLYPFGLLLIGARIVSRRLLLGSFKKLQIDDWIMMFVAVTFTGVIVSVNQVSTNLSNYLPPGVAESFTPEEHANAVYGSKFVMVLEEFMLANTWLCKACLLILYHQMTLGLKQNKLVKIVGAYCVFGYILVQILYLAVWCRPFKQYWQVPVDNSQCASYYDHLITASVFNITSDLMMIYIPLPILIRARLPLKRKIILCGVFSLGFLVILCAILNRYYNFTAGFGSLIYLNWYVGEAATSVFVANVPHLWPLLSRIFALGAFNSLRRTTGNSNSGAPNSGSNANANNNSTNRWNKASAQRSSRRLGRSETQDGYLRTESEERIVRAGAKQGGTWPLPTTPASDERTLEMGPVEGKGLGYTATAAAGQGLDAEKAPNAGGGIVRTVQIRQYSSENV
ncbi:MAG: hypothetical protein LQ346_002150 [Caloplaca aetnensis]|nr:MAG: hypothetical protein LQ346_002150 [Caloplaca aetnensis]